MIKHSLMLSIGFALWGSALAQDGNDIHSTVRTEVARQLAQPELWRHLIQEALVVQGLEAMDEDGSVASMPEADEFTDEEREAFAESLEAALELADGGAIRATVNSPAFHVDNDSGVLFQGTYNTGGIPAEGTGTRMMWYPGKSAFRVGIADGTEWDDLSVGSRSIAMGHGTTASGLISTAMGYNTTASGITSTAMGQYTTASGTASTAMGDHTTASGGNSTAMGYGTTASGYYSTAMGELSTASMDYSTAMGYRNLASGESSTAMGRFTRALSFAETSIGAFNTDYTPVSTFSWNASDRLFVIGKGSSGASRADALVMLKSGDTTLNGTLSVTSLAAASATDLCINGSTLSTCSSSGRYKDHIEPLPLGLAVVEKLQPVSFQWKDRDEHDLGFVAEEVAAVDSILATYKDGQIEGVKYKQLTAVLVNAVKEQQAEIAALRARITDQDERLRQYDDLAKKVAALERHQQASVRMASFSD